MLLSPGEKAKSVLGWMDPAFFKSSECRAGHASGVRLWINDMDKSCGLVNESCSKALRAREATIRPPIS